jgi:hypothetical protein
LCLSRSPFFCHDLGATNIVRPPPGRFFTLFFGLLPCGFSRLLFSFSSFYLLLLFDLSALQLFLTTEKLREVLFRNFCLNSCNFFLLAAPQICQPIKVFPYKAGHLFRTFDRTTNARTDDVCAKCSS